LRSDGCLALPLSGKRLRPPLADWPADDRGQTPGPATRADIDDALERARSYALLWLMLRDENLRRAAQIKEGLPQASG
jgi:hypothetical protein